MFQNGYLITLGIAIIFPIILVSARFCDGGHRCSPPKECCAQGCCYLYAPPSAPRTPPPNSSHLINIYVLNHWIFWCVVVTIIFAIICACSLWKKRRQLCNWGFPGPHSLSGDSAGSCYAPPQYSRCNSFHHPPPPYREVTSKPDLYPLVFTCNADSGKSGASYLMVQYFRNYIVRPSGSLSATSTIDSLSSSYICTANETNMMVPPPYSRANSPELPMASNGCEYTISRSASQQGCSFGHYSYRAIPAVYATSEDSNNHFTNERSISHSHTSESVNFQRINSSQNAHDSLSNMNLSHSDQQFRYNANSCSNLSSSAHGNNKVIGIANANSLNLESATNKINNYSSPLYGSGPVGNLTPDTVDPGVNHERNHCRGGADARCQMLPHTQQFSEESPVTNVDVLKKYESMRSYLNSMTGSAVSSLTNIDFPTSPPQATSPTGEVKELLEQIRQLQKDNSTDGLDEVPHDSSDQHMMPSTSTDEQSMPPQQPTKRPSSLQQRKSSRTRYFPISATRSICSPIGSNSWLTFGRNHKRWISRSAPSTPDTGLLPGFLQDHSPLLNEHDEDVDQNT